MKKVERINTMMRYINNRAYFTISEIMEEFAISRSTAIRDVNDIEAMGMPLVSEVGRGGGYSVMNNSFLPSIRFDNKEVKALFIAFMATRNQQLPYLRSRQSLSEKLIGMVSESQKEELVTLNEVLLFEGMNPYNPDLLDLSDLPHPMLEKLIQLILIDRYLLLSLEENGEIEQASIYLLHLYKEKTNWFVDCIDLSTKKKRIITVDQLSDVKVVHSHKDTTQKNLEQFIAQVQQQPNVILDLGVKAIVQYKKYSPFGVILHYTNAYQTEARLETYVTTDNTEEIKEMINWLLFLGEDMRMKQLPSIMIELIKERSKQF